MPRFAHLKTNLICPFCQTTLTDLVAFQWGFCPSYGPMEKYIYQINAPIYWKVCQDGSIPAWTYFHDGDKEVANIGDPVIKDLIVRDSSYYWQGKPKCQSCQNLLGGAVVKILEGVIREAWVYKPHEFNENIDIYLILADGILKPMPEWYDHPMTTLKDC